MRNLLSLKKNHSLVKLAKRAQTSFLLSRLVMNYQKFSYVLLQIILICGILVELITPFATEEYLDIHKVLLFLILSCVLRIEYLLEYNVEQTA